MCNQAIPRPKQFDQLLFVIRSKSNIDKSQVIKSIYKVYNIISKIDRIFITASTRTAANNINSSILHIVLGIDTQKTKASVQVQQKLEKLWYNKTAMIVNKMSMVSLDFFVTIDLYFNKAKFLYKNLSSILDGLSVLILLGNFF